MKYPFFINTYQNAPRTKIIDKSTFRSHTKERTQKCTSSIDIQSEQTECIDRVRIETRQETILLNYLLKNQVCGF